MKKINKIIKIAQLLILAGMLFSCNKKSNKVWIIDDFGAVGDSLTINTKAIQKAIDVCSESGGGTVLIKEGIYISGTIFLKDSVNLHLEENAKLIGSSNPLHYKNIDEFEDATGQTRGNCLIGAKNAKHIGISGKGIIDGNGIAFTQEQLKVTAKKYNVADHIMFRFGSNRPFLLRFVESSDIKLKNIELRQGAAWACHFYKSNDIVVDSVKIYNHANKNNDGIDIDSSHDVSITNCDINSEDDAICIKSTNPKPSYNINVSNCKLKSDWGAIKFGTESMGDFYNINIKDCKIYDTKGGGIKILSVDGANIENINISDIEMENVDMPIFIRLGERLRTYREAPRQEVGTITGVKIKNIKATTRDLDNSRVNPPSGIFITGTPNHKIANIELENINIKLPGSNKEFDLVKVEEQETNYPEFSFFKVLPAYGLYGRHIENLSLKNVKFETVLVDFREDVILEDVTKHQID